MKDNNPHTGIPPIPIEYRMQKFYQLAKTRKGYTTQKANNSSVELAFMKVLKQVKEILARNPQIVFERDQRKDNTHNAFTIHSFLSSDIFLELSCDITCNFYVEYAFLPSSYNLLGQQDEIGKLLQTYPLDTKAKEIQLEDFSAFFKRVLQVQDQRFIYLLERKR
jgi:hypothetical protein